MNALSITEQSYSINLVDDDYKVVILEIGGSRLRHDKNRNLKHRDLIAAGLNSEQAAKALCEIFFITGR